MSLLILCREAINFAIGDCCTGCSQIILHFVLDASTASTGCHFKNGGWMYGTEVFSGEGDFPTDTETSLDFNFEQSSIKVPCTDSESFVRGGPTLTMFFSFFFVFFQLVRGGMIQIPL